MPLSHPTSIQKKQHYQCIDSMYTPWSLGILLRTIKQDNLQTWLLICNMNIVSANLKFQHFFFFYRSILYSHKQTISRWKRQISPKGDKFAPLTRQAKCKCLTVQMMCNEACTRDAWYILELGGIPVHTEYRCLFFLRYEFLKYNNTGVI